MHAWLSWNRFAAGAALLCGLTLSAAAAVAVFCALQTGGPSPLADYDGDGKKNLPGRPPAVTSSGGQDQAFPRQSKLDAGGFMLAVSSVEPWPEGAAPVEIGAAWTDATERAVKRLDRQLKAGRHSPQEKADLLLSKALLFNYDGHPGKAYEALKEMRAVVAGRKMLTTELLYSVIYLQGVTALRLGETENCVMCRGESSCILPIGSAAIHKYPQGSRLAIGHFTEYLEKFPDDLEVRWLLNVAHMTLGEHPTKVDPRYLISLDQYNQSEFDIGRFRDIGHLVGVNRYDQAGGAIMDDFDNDGLLDLVETTFDPTGRMAFYRNKGTGTFDEVTKAAGLTEQLGGLYCVQTDYNNDGHLDIFICRGAWMSLPMRPSLLKNNGNGTFTDVTEIAGVAEPVNSISACWADYDNDGWLDLFVCCERQVSRLYHNQGNGTFREVSEEAGLQPGRKIECKGAAWIDYDNDGYQDLFLNHQLAYNAAELFHNNRDGTFSDVTIEEGLDGPVYGFSCWSWDYDNDGWLDIFATSYDRTLEDVVRGMTGKPHNCHSNRLYRNRQGQGFENVVQEAGLDMVFAAMGTNYSDFDNDGYLDMYLGTGEPELATIVPSRMFKNVAGRRFAEITSSSGTGHLQKGHAVACGDWNRDGNIDIFFQMGGAIPGDAYHNVLFQNPGHDNHWLALKLVGKKTNRPAIGARVKVVTSGDNPLTVHRHISSGSSFGANPLQPTIGLGPANRISLLEIHWPTSGTTQIFRDVAVNQSLEITEFAENYEVRRHSPIPVPPDSGPSVSQSPAQ